ncbi:MAG: hypothetical protein QXT67_04715 [Candidatus Bathyarchaeia archaeon]
MPLAESLSTLLYVGRHGKICKYGKYIFSYPKENGTIVFKDAYDVNVLILSQIASNMKPPVTAISFIAKDVNYDYTRFFPYIRKELNECVNILVDGTNVSPEEKDKLYFTNYALILKKLSSNFNYAGTLFVVGYYKPLGVLGLCLRRLRHKMLLRRLQKKAG